MKKKLWKTFFCIQLIIVGAANQISFEVYAVGHGGEANGTNLMSILITTFLPFLLDDIISQSEQ